MGTNGLGESTFTADVLYDYVSARLGPLPLLRRVAGPDGHTYLGAQGNRTPVVRNVRQSLYRGRVLGGFERPRLQQAHLWFLGRRRDVPGACRGDRPGRVDVEERIQSACRHRPEPRIRQLRGARVDG